MACVMLGYRVAICSKQKATSCTQQVWLHKAHLCTCKQRMWPGCSCQGQDASPIRVCPSCARPDAALPRPLVLHTGQYSQAVEKYARARDNLAGMTHPDAAALRKACLLNLGSCFLNLQQHQQALEACQEVLAGEAGQHTSCAAWPPVQGYCLLSGCMPPYLLDMHPQAEPQGSAHVLSCICRGRPACR